MLSILIWMLKDLYDKDKFDIDYIMGINLIK